ncbi:MAG: hypothetical protein QM674_10680 [Burkholderiaceae bacterium]
MTFFPTRVWMIAASLACAAAMAFPAGQVSAAQGPAKEAVQARPGRSVEASARERARELNQDSALRGAGHAHAAHAETARGQASMGVEAPASAAPRAAGESR